MPFLLSAYCQQSCESLYDFRTNKHFTLKENRLTRTDLDEFVACFNPTNRHEREPTWSEKNKDGRWRPFTYDEIMARDKASLDIFWLRDESLEDSATLPEPHLLAEEIAPYSAGRRLKAMSRNFRTLLGTVALMFAVLFTVLGAGQYWFVSYRLHETTKNELWSWAEDIKDDIALHRRPDPGFSVPSQSVPRKR